MLMLLLALNFMGNIFRYKLYRKEKLSVLCFHVGFIVILIGAGITRYTGFEGVMRIREGESSKVIISDQNYLQFDIKNEKDDFSFGEKNEVDEFVHCKFNSIKTP
jgi:cytochrome c biogenesis protein ResB